MKKNPNEFKNELKCFQCNQIIYRTSSASVYADLSEHYKKIHGLEMSTVQFLRKKKSVPPL